MEVRIDARKKQCPIPLILTKNAIKEMQEPGEVHVVVDNEIAMQNITKMADHKSLSFDVNKVSEQEYQVCIRVTSEDIGKTKPDTAGKTVDADANPEPEYENCCPQKNITVVVSADHMGEGDDTLGRLLIKGFLYALTQQEEAPSVVLFYNGGAKLTCEDSASLEDLKVLQDAGTKIYTCGTCLNHYGLGDKLKIGEVTNMYDIARMQLEADKIIKP